MTFNKTIVCFFIGLLFTALQSNAQKFDTRGGDIPEFNGTYHRYYYPLVVKGLHPHLNDSFGLEKICISINHPKVSDLKIELMSPDSTMIWITNRNGGDSGENYIETCFSDAGFNGYIYEGKAPFLGTYIPDGRIFDFNNNENPNGTWYLVIQDLKNNNKIGVLNGFSLQFGKHPIKPQFKPCNFKNPGACQCADSKKKSCELLPDLVVSEKMTKILYQEYAQDDPVYPGQLRMAIATANIGSGPLEVRGTHRWVCGGSTVSGPVMCPDSSYSRQFVDQIIYKKVGDSLIETRQAAGTNYYDSKPGHNHFHSDRWVEVTIRKKNRKKDPHKWPILGKGSKVSYCLFDSGNCKDSNDLCQKGPGVFAGPSNLPNYGFGHYIQCESYVQGISVGGIDNYGMTFEGQFVPIPKDICNGTYMLMVEVDPDNNYKEENENNNYIVVPVTFHFQNGCKNTKKK